MLVQNIAAHLRIDFLCANGKENRVGLLPPRSSDGAIHISEQERKCEALRALERGKGIAGPMKYQQKF